MAETGSTGKPHMDQKSRKLQKARRPEDIFQHFDAWQKEKEEKLARKQKKAAEEEVKELRAAPDISKGLSRQVQLMQEGDIAERYTQLTKSSANHRKPVEAVDVAWSVTPVAARTEGTFASQTVARDETTLTRLTAAQIARETALADPEPTFGEAFVHHSMNPRPRLPASPPLSDASASETSAPDFVDRLHAARKLLEPEQLDFKPNLTHTGVLAKKGETGPARVVPDEYVDGGHNRRTAYHGSAHERLYSIAAKNDQVKFGASLKQSSPPVRRAPRVAAAPTWAHIMKMQSVPVDGGRRDPEPAEVKSPPRLKQRPPVSLDTRPAWQPSPAANTSYPVSPLQDAGSYAAAAAPVSDVSANATEQGGMTVSFSQGKAQRALDQTHELETRATFEQAKVEEKRAVQELVTLERVALEARRVDVESRTQELLAKQKLELELTGIAPHMDDLNTGRGEAPAVDEEEDGDDPFTDLSAFSSATTAAIYEDDSSDNNDEASADGPPAALQDALASLSAAMDAESSDEEVLAETQQPSEAELAKERAKEISEESFAQKADMFNRIASEQEQKQAGLQTTSEREETTADTHVEASEEADAKEEGERMAAGGEDRGGQLPISNPMGAASMSGDSDNEDADEELTELLGSDSAGEAEESPDAPSAVSNPAADEDDDGQPPIANPMDAMSDSESNQDAGATEAAVANPASADGDAGEDAGEAYMYMYEDDQPAVSNPMDAASSSDEEASSKLTMNASALLSSKEEATEDEDPFADLASAIAGEVAEKEEEEEPEPEPEPEPKPEPDDAFGELEAMFG